MEKHQNKDGSREYGFYCDGMCSPGDYAYVEESQDHTLEIMQTRIHGSGS